MSGCWICDGPVLRCALFEPAPFLQCQSCGFAFRPDLTSEALSAVYEGGDYEDIRGAHYLRELDERRRDARVRLRYMRPWVSSGKLLDVGAAGGAFVAEAAASGFAASGIEPVPSFARAAREQLGLDVRDGGIEEADLGAGEFDVITLWHVLEHLPEPVEQLARLAQALDMGGTLAVEVPNAASAVALHMGGAWPSLEPTVHVNQLTPTSLRLALERAGLTLRDLRTTTITPYLRPRAKLGAGHIAGRLKAAYWLHDPRQDHASGHELLRAVAQRP